MHIHLLFLLPLVQALSQVSVVNRCKFPVFLRSVQRDASPIQRLDPHQKYSEIYRPVANNTGVSIKIASNAGISTEEDEQNRSATFNTSPITQLEYSYVPWNAPVDLFYDLSAINDSPEGQFCHYGYDLYTTSIKCEAVLCPPQCDTFCPNVYNRPDDDWATKGCNSNAGLELVLCSSNPAVS